MSKSALTLLLCAITLAGCATVTPWQRGRLAGRDMAPDPNPPLSALRSHLHDSRESAAGGHTAEGGGCGCT